VKKILVTGGTGYIGSHVVTKLLKKNYKVFIFDNLSNSRKSVLNKIKKITGKSVKFIKGDLKDKKSLKKLFSNYFFDEIIHFAALKAVRDSELKPKKYYNNNVIGSLNLIKYLKTKNLKRIIFSSSAAVYGYQKKPKLVESMIPKPINNYGKNKLLIEKAFQKFKLSFPKIQIVVLRYFNAVGAHPSGLLGENPRGTPNNLMPYVLQVLTGKKKKLHIFGKDYLTKDGTGLRDYIHVQDLANAHLLSLKHKNKYNNKISIFNIGTGKTYSVMDVLKTFEKISKKKIPYKFYKKRKGDLAEIYADASLANKDLKWFPKFNLMKICSDAWNFQKKNS